MAICLTHAHRICLCVALAVSFPPSPRRGPSLSLAGGYWLCDYVATGGKLPSSPWQGFKFQPQVTCGTPFMKDRLTPRSLPSSDDLSGTSAPSDAPRRTADATAPDRLDSARHEDSLAT